MTQKEMKAKREKMDMEILGMIDALTRMVKSYARAIGETRPMTISISARSDEPYINALGYVNLSWCEEQGMTKEEAHDIPNLFNVTRLSNGKVFHMSLGNDKRILGEGEEAAE